MSYKLSNKTKKHIADMATRQKYQATFNTALETFKRAILKELQIKNQSELFADLHPVVLAACNYQTTITLSSDKIDISSIRDAVSYRNDYIEILTLSARVYGESRYGSIYPDDTWSPHLKELRNVIDEIAHFRSTLSEALYPFRSGEKLIKALPWAEHFYPDADKTPTVNIVPVSLIEKANELMGVK